MNVWVTESDGVTPLAGKVSHITNMAGCILCLLTYVCHSYSKVLVSDFEKPATHRQKPMVYL